MLWWRKRRDREARMARELDFHVEAQVQEYVAAGLSEEESRRRARLEFGNPAVLREECRDEYRKARGGAWIESTLRDVQYAVRTLRKSPAFTAAAIVTLALGIGANTAIFQLLDAVRLRNLPVPNPQQLAKIQIRGGNLRFGIMHDERQLTFPVFEELRRRQQGFSGIFAWESIQLRIGERPQTRQVAAIFVTGDYFSTLGIAPKAGRLINAGDDQRGCAAPGVVISDALWNTEFGGHPSAIGQRLVVNNRPLEVIGVTPASFSGLSVGNRFEVAVPLCAAPLVGMGYETRADVFSLEVQGRLKPGWSLAQASDNVAAISPGTFDTAAPAGYPAASIERFKKYRMEAVSAANGVSGLRDRYNDALAILLGITGLVLVIACANLANLSLARAAARGREFAVRLALGASRARLIRACLCESLLLSLAGTSLGLLLAGVLSRGVVVFLRPGDDPIQLDLSLDWRMLAFLATVATMACVLFGLVPALRAARVEPGAAIKSGGRSLTADGAGLSFQRALVVAQVSISLMLVAGALLFVRSFRNLITLDPGFRTQGVLIAFVDGSGLRLPRPEIKRFGEQLLEEVRSIPQVESAATTTHIPVGGGSWSLAVRGTGVDASAQFTWVSPRYFETMDMPILAGRDFTARDSETSPKVAVVNRKFVERFFAGRDAVGKTFRSAGEPDYPETEYQIVAVVPNSRYWNLRDEPPPICYAPIAQHPSLGPWVPIFVKASPAALPGLRTAIRTRILQAHPGVEAEFRIFEDEIRGGLLRDRLMAALSGFFGALAAVLATIGLYGVMSYIVARRRNEIGIRMALGAGRGQVVGLVMKDALRMLAIGVAIGTAGALALAHSASALLFGLKASDPPTLIAAAVLLAAASALGSFLPARRGSRLDPMAALRD